MYNRGFEVGVNGDIIRAGKFTWTMGVNITTIKNEITKMPETVPEFIDGTKKYSVGASRYDYWIRTYYGIDSDDGSVLYVANNTTAASGIRYIKTNREAVPIPSPSILTTLNLITRVELFLTFMAA